VGKRIIRGSCVLRLESSAKRPIRFTGTLELRRHGEMMMDLHRVKDPASRPLICLRQF